MMGLSVRYRLVLLAAVPVTLLFVDAGHAVDVTATCTPGPCNTWRASDVTLVWTQESGSFFKDGECNPTPPPFTVEGSVPRSCTVTNALQTESVRREVTIQIDKTAPRVIGAIPSLGPNALGWQLSAVAFAFVGTDASQANATSGIAGCSQIPYSGPDTPAASIQGTCRDGAGNISPPYAHTFKYDATPPTLTPLTAEADDRVVALQWTRPEAPIEIARTPGIGDEATSVVYRGPAESFIDTKVKNSVTYQYRATVTDQAGHATTQVVGARPFRGFFAPANGARVTGAPRLAWTEIRNAGYYNIQLFRGSKKILSVWPKTTAYALRSTWKFQGTRFKLAPGAYRVYIWPGFGAFAKQRYGRIVGSRTFVVRPR